MVRRTDIQEAIRHKILHGEFEPGESVPEESLAAEFSSSRTPIREALIMLSNDGIIDNEPNRGFSVASVSIERIRSTFEAMRAIYPDLAQLAMGRVDDAERATFGERNAEGRSTAMDHFKFMAKVGRWSRNAYLMRTGLATETYHGFVRNSVAQSLSAQALETAEKELYLHENNLLDALTDRDADGLREEVEHMTEGCRVFLISHLL